MTVFGIKLNILQTLMHGEAPKGDTTITDTPRAAPAPQQRKSLPESILAELFGKGPSGGDSYIEITDREAGG